MHNERFNNVRAKIILITGHYELLKENGIFNKYDNIIVLKRHGNGGVKGLTKALENLNKSAMPPSIKI
jgi:hypothetical protein